MQDIATLPNAPTTVPEKRNWKPRPALRLLAVCGMLFPRAMGRIALKFFTRPRRKPRAQEELLVLHAAKEFPKIPFQSKRIDRERGATMLQCYVWGSGSHTVVLAHGWESYAGRLTGFVAPLVAAGYRVVAFDGPAHGESNGLTTDLPDFAHAIRTVIEHFGPVETVIAHSFGAASTLWYLSDPTPSPLKKLILLGAPSGVQFMLGVFSERLHLPDAVRQVMVDGITRRYQCKMEELDLPARIGSLTIPTLMIHDRDDNLVPYAEGVALHQALPNATLHTTEGLYHSATLHDPAVIDCVMEFLHSEVVTE